MKKTTIITGLITLLLAFLAGLPNAEAGLIKVINNSNFVLNVEVSYSDGSQSSPTIINPNSSNPGLGSPTRAVSRIRVVNTTSGTDYNRALLEDYWERSPRIILRYDIAVDKQGVVTLKSYNPSSFLGSP